MKQNKSQQGEKITNQPECCEYQKSICPKNIPKYSMKCIFNKDKCQIRKYFKRYEGLDINMLGIGSLK